MIAKTFSIRCYAGGKRKLTNKLKLTEAINFHQVASHLVAYLGTAYPIHEMLVDRAITGILNSFQEVIWDRWAGQKQDMTVFGWIGRDFVLLRITAYKVSFVVTSSAKYSEVFAKRMGGTHRNCCRVEHDFPNAQSIKLKKKTK